MISWHREVSVSRVDHKEVNFSVANLSLILTFYSSIQEHNINVWAIYEPLIIGWWFFDLLYITTLMDVFEPDGCFYFIRRFIIFCILYCLIYIIGLITGPRYAFVPHPRHENVAMLARHHHITAPRRILVQRCKYIKDINPVCILGSLCCANPKWHFLTAPGHGTSIRRLVRQRLCACMHVLSVCM